MSGGRIHFERLSVSIRGGDHHVWARFYFDGRLESVAFASITKI